MNRVHIAALAIVALLASPILHAQAKQSPSRSELEAEVKRLRTALDECRSANASKRDEAIASLRAVQSALGTGANLDEFKRYQIESRIKVDALPMTPENAGIRAVSDLYADAVKFRIIYATDGAIEGTALAAAQTRYAHDESITKALNGDEVRGRGQRDRSETHRTASRSRAAHSARARVAGGDGTNDPGD